MGKRTRHSAEFKARVAPDAIRGEQLLSELASRRGIRPAQISQLKRQAAAQMAAQSGGGAVTAVKEQEAGAGKLHARIGQLLVERDFPAKAFGRQARIEG